MKFTKTAVSRNLTPDHVLDQNKPFSTGRYKSTDGRGCNFSVLGERKYDRGSPFWKYSDYIYSDYIYKEPRK